MESARIFRSNREVNPDLVRLLQEVKDRVIEETAVPDGHCHGCTTAIVEGQHFMKVRVEIDTRMPADYEPVVETEPTVFEVVVHNPGCFQKWAMCNRVILDVFAR